MIDTDNLLKGQHYSELPTSFIPFICKHNPLGKNIPICTFEQIAQITNLPLQTVKDLANNLTQQN
jgi:hypothetical protein